MEQVDQVIKNGNKTEYYLGGRIILTITDLGNNYYIVENTVSKLEGYCTALDNNKTICRLDKNFTRGKNGRLYRSKRLIDHNTKWFAYILEKEGFVSPP